MISEVGYQIELKREVAESIGLSWKDLDLPYEQWAAIRNAYERNDMQQVRNLVQAICVKED